MASLRLETDRGRTGWRLQFVDASKRRRSLWLGDVPNRAAETIARHITELVRAFGAGVAPEAESARWANELTGRLRQRIAVLGLVGAERRSNTVDAVRLCKPYFESYIASRTDLKQATRVKYTHSADCFIKYVGKTRLLSDVTPSDIDAWRLWMVKKGIFEGTDTTPPRGLAVATANKHAKRVKKMFAQAVRARLLCTLPAADQKIGAEVNRERDYYIDNLTSQKLLKQCRDGLQPEWALIFGLCRYAGFRCPSEVLGLTWADVNWSENRLRVDSIKTGLRFCPIFPELRQLLEAAFNDAPEGTLHCVRRYRSSETNLRTQFGRLLTSAGVKPWPKIFVNLRASCRTDLQEQFPDHVVNTWLGHSSRVAERHYLQTTDAHWERAGLVTAVFGGVAGGIIPADPAASAATPNAKIPGNMASDSAGLPGILSIMPPQGLEPWTR